MASEHKRGRNYFYKYKIKGKPVINAINVPAIPALNFNTVKKVLIIPYLNSKSINEYTGLTYERAKNAEGITPVPAHTIAPIISLNGVIYSTFTGSEIAANKNEDVYGNHTYRYREAQVFSTIPEAQSSLTALSQEGDISSTLTNGSKISRSLPDIKADDVIAWLVTQPNANGALYLDKVIRSYMSALRNAPQKLTLDESVNRNVFACHTVEDLDKLWHAFKAAPNYFEVNRTPWHGQLSAGLAAYRRYIEYLDKTTGESGGKTMVKLEHDSARFVQQTVRDAFRLWLTEHNHEWSNGTVTIHCSDAYYLFNNERGITLEEALTAEDGLQRAYDAIERHFINNPTQINNPSGSARGYLCSLRMLKDFLVEKFPELLNKDSIAVDSASIVPDSLIEVLNQNYTSGFRFETTALRLLSTTAGVEVDERMQAALKRCMFRRNDDICFLLDTVVNATTRKDIVEFAEAYLQEYGCFEITELYKLYEDKINPKCIGDVDDFESFYMQIGNSGVRCVAAPQIGNRIARFSNGNVWGTFKEVSAKIVSAITNEFYGSVNEDDLHTKFCAFSTDLLSKIIKNCAADELVRVEINDSICYQTFDALGLPDNLSDMLSETLERLSDIGLEPNQDVLHTAISLKLGVNFLAEFNLPDWDTFRRLITVFYKAEPRREWKRNVFGEVTG